MMTYRVERKSTSRGLHFHGSFLVLPRSSFGVFVGVVIVFRFDVQSRLKRSRLRLHRFPLRHEILGNSIHLNRTHKHDIHSLIRYNRCHNGCKHLLLFSNLLLLNFTQVV